MKINFYKVHNDFGGELPATYAEFYAVRDNEITPHMLKEMYKDGSKYRCYEKFKADYEKFVDGLVPSSQGTKDEA